MRLDYVSYQQQFIKLVNFEAKLKYHQLTVLLAIGIWFAANYALMIAPVWDEINFYNMFSPFKNNMAHGLHYLWFEYVLYRPLATTFLAFSLSFIPPNVVWPLLRLINALMIIASYWLVADAAKRWHGEANGLSKNTLTTYWLAALLSPAALIVSSWYANIFDASCLLLIALGLSAWTRNRPLLAGCLFGLAWFCKEAAIFVVPLMIYLYAIKPAAHKQTLIAFAVYLVFCFIYWGLRSRIILLGNTADIHPLKWSDFFNAIPAAAIRLSLPGLTMASGGVGIMLTIILALSARSILFLGYVFALILSAALIYQGTIAFGVINYHLQLLNPAIFDARLFHIPITLLMFGLLLQRQAWPFLVLISGFLLTTPFQFKHYQQFQLTYLSYYQLALQKPQGVVLFADKLSGIQHFGGNFGLTIGDYPKADFKINPIDGSLSPMP